MDQIKVQVRFTMERDGRSFSDALYFSQEEWAALLPEDLETQKEARFQAWLAVLAAPVEDDPLEGLVG